MKQYSKELRNKKLIIKALKAVSALFAFKANGGKTADIVSGLVRRTDGVTVQDIVAATGLTLRQAQQALQDEIKRHDQNDIEQITEPARGTVTRIKNQLN